MFSCFYLAISLFLSHLVINDILTNVVESSTVTDALVDSCKDAFKTLNVDEDKAREVVTSIQQDPTTQKLISEYLDTAINDAMLGENTYDDSLLKEALKNKKEDVYDYCCKLIREVGPKGYIMCSGCDVPFNANFENVRQMQKAVEDYGKVN